MFNLSSPFKTLTVIITTVFTLLIFTSFVVGQHATDQPKMAKDESKIDAIPGGHVSPGERAIVNQVPDLPPQPSALQQIWEFELFNSGDAAIRLNQVIIAFLVILFGIWLSKRFTHLLGLRIQKIKNVDISVAHTVQRLTHYVLIVVITLGALPLAGIPITVFTVLGGALAIGVGFGAQNLFNNLISGLIIMIERPIRVGDITTINGNNGTIAEIGNRCVRVRRSDGIDVLVPNSHFLEQPVVNWTLGDSHVRGCVPVGVAYGSPTREVTDFMMQAAEEHSRVIKRPKHWVVFQDFGDNSLVFELYFWCSVRGSMELRIIQSELRYRIDELFRQAGITIAFPQRDLHIDTLKPVEIKMVKN